MSEQPENAQPADAGVGHFDPVLEHRFRLGACVLLSSVDAMNFGRLKELLSATDGNLGAQMRKLEEAEYIEARKEFRDRRPVTWYSLTDAGRQALQRHLAALRTLITAAELGQAERNQK